MPTPLVWSESRDDLLHRLRGDGRSWDSIAALLGISRWAAIQRGRFIGAKKPPAPPRAAHEDPANREALPPGHAASWGAITAGTVLAGAPYPYPPAELDRATARELDRIEAQERWAQERQAQERSAQEWRAEARDATHHLARAA